MKEEYSDNLVNYYLFCLLCLRSVCLDCPDGRSQQQTAPALPRRHLRGLLPLGRLCLRRVILVFGLGHKRKIKIELMPRDPNSNIGS